jgi:hypothetical protein
MKLIYLALILLVIFARLSSALDPIKVYTDPQYYSFQEGGFGTSIDITSDFNGDGFKDVVIGAPYKGFDKSLDPQGKTPLNAPSRVLVYSGKNGSLLYNFKKTAPDGSGTLVKSNCDVNGDGTPDILVAGFLNGIQAYSGKTGALLYSVNETGGGNFGYDFDCAGDLNGDGRQDFVVGDPQINWDKPGYVKLISGSNGTTLATLTLPSYMSGKLFGYSVAAGKDITGDGKPDILVGVPDLSYIFDDSSDPCNGFYPDAGAVLVFVGSAKPKLWDYYFPGDPGCGNEKVGEALGKDVEFAGDVNGDGVQDFMAIGGDKHPVASAADYARVKIISPTSGTVIHKFLVSNSSDEHTPFAAAGDVNGDGHADYVISSPEVIWSTNYSSMALLISGKTGGILHTFDSPSGDFGFAISVGDVTGGGKIEVAVATPGFYKTYSEQFKGTVSLYSPYMDFAAGYGQGGGNQNGGGSSNSGGSGTGTNNNTNSALLQSVITDLTIARGLAFELRKGVPKKTAKKYVATLKKRKKQRTQLVAIIFGLDAKINGLSVTDLTAHSAMSALNYGLLKGLTLKGETLPLKSNAAKNIWKSVQGLATEMLA